MSFSKISRIGQIYTARVTISGSDDQIFYLPALYLVRAKINIVCRWFWRPQLIRKLGFLVSHNQNKLSQFKLFIRLKISMYRKKLFYQFVLKTHDTWHQTPGTWHVTLDMWHMEGDKHSLKMSAPQLLWLGMDSALKIFHKGFLNESMN